MSELIREGSSEITVSGLCQRAGVSRPTFYQHFKTTDDVLVAALEERLTALEASGAGADPLMVLTAFLRDLDEDRPVYQRAIVSTWQYGRAHFFLVTWLAQRLTSRMEDEDGGPRRLTRALFAAGGVFALLEHWLAGGEESVDEMAVILRDQVRLALHGE